MTKIILIGAILLLALIRFTLPFFRERVLDKKELDSCPINVKFGDMLDKLDESIFNGQSTVTVYDDNPEYMQMEGPSNMNVSYTFMYTTGNLTVQIIFNNGDGQKLINKQYNSLRNVDHGMQERLASLIVADTMLAHSQLS